jgi:hypothetical protein
VTQLSADFHPSSEGTDPQLLSTCSFNCYCFDPYREPFIFSSRRLKKPAACASYPGGLSFYSSKECHSMFLMYFYNQNVETKKVKLYPYFNTRLGLGLK